MALTALLVADVVTYVALRSFLFTRVDQTLEQNHSIFENASLRPGGGSFPGFPPGGTGPGGGNDGGGGGGTQAPPSFLVTVAEVRSPSGQVVQSYYPSVSVGGKAYSPALPAHVTGFSTAANNEQVSYFDAGSVPAGGPGFRVRASILQGGPDQGDVLIVAQPLNETTATLDQLLLVEGAVSAAALLLALLLGWFTVRAGLRPLTDVERTAESIADGLLDERVPGENTRTEVGRLARTVNIMLTRIQEAFAQRDATEADLRASEERMRRFVADASHELRTPLAAVSAYAELFDRGASERADDLERVMRGIRQETGRMGELVQDLLLLARLDEGRPLGREQVELVALAADAVATASTVGPDWPVRLQAQLPVEVPGDGARLRQVLDNLLANVRAHTPPGTATTVTVSEVDGSAVIEVADEGPGLSPDQAARVFERFYRADPSRSRSHGGAGLGLSIVASIVGAHHGSVVAASVSGGGAVFTVRLPVTAVGSPEASS